MNSAPFVDHWPRATVRAVNGLPWALLCTPDNYISKIPPMLLLTGNFKSLILVMVPTPWPIFFFTKARKPQTQDRVLHSPFHPFKLIFITFDLGTSLFQYSYVVCCKVHICPWVNICIDIPTLLTCINPFILCVCFWFGNKPKWKWAYSEFKLSFISILESNKIL